MLTVYDNVMVSVGIVLVSMWLKAFDNIWGDKLGFTRID